MFEYWISYHLVVWTWASHLTPLTLSFFTYKMELMPIIFYIRYVETSENIIYLEIHSKPGRNYVLNEYELWFSHYGSNYESQNGHLKYK